MPLAVKAVVLDPVSSAKSAGLRYVQNFSRGFTRKRAGTGWSFLDLNGKPIRDAEELRRIRSLVIPPAWTDVWICPSPTGHLQAVGFDARGRKQYRYHPDYTAIRNLTKFGRMAEFGGLLPKIRARVEKDLAQEGLPRTKVLAAVVRLLETTCIRVGNEEYVKQNKSFGLTTLRNRHVVIEGWKVKFHFRGKSGQDHEIAMTDRRLSKVLHDCRDLPGCELFQYLDDAEERHAVNSEDVNEYLREIGADGFTAKDFRTWAGTSQAAKMLRDLGPGESETECKRKIVEAVKAVAGVLGNRPATCRKYYVHPVVLDAFCDGTLFRHEAVDEACVLALLGKPNGCIAA